MTTWLLNAIHLFPHSLILDYSVQLGCVSVSVKTSIVRATSLLLVVYGASVFGILIDSSTALFFWEKFLYFPVALFGADGEFEIFSSDRIPIL